MPATAALGQSTSMIEKSWGQPLEVLESGPRDCGTTSTFNRFRISAERQAGVPR